MAVFSLEIADIDVERVLTAVAMNYGWPIKVHNPAYVVITIDEPNPDYDPEDPESGPPTIEVTVLPVDGEGNPIPTEIDNPETSGDFTHRMVRNFLSEHVASYERRLATQSALEGLDTNVDIGDPG